MSSDTKNTQPPRFAKWLLESFCSYDFLSTALWDLEELFQHNVKTKGIRKAKLLYLIEVFGIVIHLFFKGKSQYSINNTAMFKHNILISFRGFKRYKSTFIINLIGLASALTATLLIYLWVTDELSTDKFHKNGDQLYQVMQNSETSAGIMTFPWTPLPLGPTLIEQFPEVKTATTLLEYDEFEGVTFLTSDNSFYKVRDQYIDENFFDVLSFPLILGTEEAFFSQLDNVLISESLAEKMFKDITSAVGKTVELQNEDLDGSFIVAGVFSDPPSNSSMQFDALFNLQKYVNAQSPSFSKWVSNNTITIAILNEGTDLDVFNDNIYGLTESFEPRAQSKLFAQKFEEKHLYGLYKEGKVVGGRIAYIRLFSLVALVIMVIACINFMNLSTAKANTRLKELGVKKALGAHRKTLIQQYFTEALILTSLAGVVATFLAVAFLPFFNNIVGKQLTMGWNSTLTLGLVGIVAVTTLLAGSYPALYLSRLKVIASLKGKLAGGFGDVWARKGLVVFQFCVSIILIVGVLIISNQINYIHSKNLGYDRDNVLQFANLGIDEENSRAFQSAIDAIPGVIEHANAGHDLTGNYGRTGGVSWPGKVEGEQLSFVNLEVGPGFTETMSIELLEGRSFDPERPGDFNKILFNETAIKQMKLENPIGQVVKVWGRQREIIGIVKDFHALSLYEEIGPLLIQSVDEVLEQSVVKIQAGTEIQTINQLEKAFDEFSGGMPFEFEFVERSYQVMYQGEKQVASLAKSFAFVAIIISCLGLLGLTSFTAQRRSKEIGIRKVLGSGTWRIIYLLSGDFTKMILTALIIGLPVSYFIAQQWVQNFAFGIELGIEYFLLAGLVILSIAWLTVGFQTLKAAKGNSVDSLRME